MSYVSGNKGEDEFLPHPHPHNPTHYSLPIPTRNSTSLLIHAIPY